HYLHRVSVEEPERFWPAVVADLGLEFSRPWDEVVDVSRGIEWARWFVGARLNLARSCIHRWAERDPDGRGAVFLGEDGERRDRRWVEPVLVRRRETAEWDCELGPGELAPLEVDSEHPYLLAYTSGTTGRPKGALHVQGGFLASIARETAYQSNVSAGDVVH